MWHLTVPTRCSLLYGQTVVRDQTMWFARKASRVYETWRLTTLRRNIKHRRPRLDQITSTVVTNVLPRIKRTLAYVLGPRRAGRARALASWQEDFKAEWLQLSMCDDHRLVEKDSTGGNYLPKPRGRTEELSQIEEEKDQPHGTYLTELDHWTCSCPAYQPILNVQAPRSPSKRDSGRRATHQLGILRKALVSRLPQGLGAWVGYNPVEYNLRNDRDNRRGL